MNIDVIIVLYNDLFSSIKSLPVLENSELVKSIIICDNSSEKNESPIVSNNKIEYIDMHGNQGLSKAYNTALRRCKSDYVLVLDDDTQLPDDFIEKIQSYVTAYKDYEVFVPIVKSEDLILSPCQKRGLRYKPFLSIDQIKWPFSAINSGSLVKREVFSAIRYREELFLDMVDHAFFDDLRNTGRQIKVMQNIILKQNYSRLTDNEETAHARYEISKKDNRTYYRSLTGGRIFCELQLIFWKIKKAVKYSDLSVLFW